MAINLDLVILNLVGMIIGSIILSPILWLVGRALVGEEKAKLTDAIWIIFLGNFINAILGAFGNAINVVGISAVIIGFIIQLLIWVGLVKHFFDTDTWLKALGISIIAAVIYVIIFAIIALILISLIPGIVLPGWPPW